MLVQALTTKADDYGRVLQAFKQLAREYSAVLKPSGDHMRLRGGTGKCDSDDRVASFITSARCIETG